MMRGSDRIQNRHHAAAGSDSDGDENVSDEPNYDAEAIISMAFDPQASLRPSFSLRGKNVEPRKPHGSLQPGRAVTTRLQSSAHPHSKLMHSERSEMAVSPRPFNLQDEVSQPAHDPRQPEAKLRQRKLAAALHMSKITAEGEVIDSDGEDESPLKSAPKEGGSVSKKLTSKRSRNSNQKAPKLQTPVPQSKTLPDLPKTQEKILTRHEANFQQRLMEAGTAFLRAKNDGKRIDLFYHSDRLYHPLKPLNSFQDGFRDLVLLVQNDPFVTTMILN